MAGKGRKSEDKLDWEELGMNLDDCDYNPAGEMLASEEAELNEYLNREVFGVRGAKLRLKSRVIDVGSLLRGAGGLSMFPVGQFSPAKMEVLFGDPDEADEDDSDEDEGGGESRGGYTSLFSEAGVSIEDGREVITYPAGNGVETKIVINRDGERPIVSIVRSGALNNSLVLEEGRRHICVYGLKIMPIEMAVYAKKVRVDFSVETGGEFEFDYLVELRGLGVQRSQVSIQVELDEPINKDE